MPHGKRRRPADKIHACFPDDDSHNEKKSTAEGTLKSSSLSKAWMKCGEGFQECPTEENSRPSGKKNQAVRHLAQSFSIDEDDCGKDPADIIWSSSDNSLSDVASEEGELLPDISELSPQSEGTLHETNVSVSLEAGSGVTSDVPTIADFQDDSECNVSEAAESVVEISDSDSSTSDDRVSRQCEPELPKALNIVEYSSEPEEEYSVTTERQDIALCEEDILTSGGRTVSDWVKTAQILLQTPEKKLDKTFKTPEDSAKKKKRFIRGGLAERLNRLQNRERSAITFWRHQSGSDCRIPLGDKSGTLLLKLIDVHEECAVWIAACQQLTDLQNSDNLAINLCQDATKLKVLFSRQTAEQLMPRPNDIIQVYPPWQKIHLKGGNMSVIINTYYSQKIIANQNEETKNKTFCSTLPANKNVPLSEVFQLDDGDSGCHVTCQSKQQVAITTTVQNYLCTLEKGLYSKHSTNDSLLDFVETQGAAGCKGLCICVVQRVYYLTLREGPKCLRQESIKATIDPSEMPSKTTSRLCLLIQDAYGIFCELQVQLPDTAIEDIEKYCQKLEGKLCLFTGLKILQRTTRGRAPGLFSLIDSLWPPLAPIKIHGQSQNQKQELNTLPAPSFCYVLALRYEEGSDCIKPGDTMSDLYLPPVIHNLHEILQVVVLSQRCSFWATVIYVRPEITSNIQMQNEFWIYVTDASLQVTPKTSGMPRVLPVCVLHSCAVDTRVLETLARNITCNIYFKDAVKEHGRIICAERTVLSLQKPLLDHASGVNELTSPVILDKLDSTTEAKSLRIVTGIINGVNERESFSWPICNLCGSSKLQPTDSDRQKYFCPQCASDVSSPVIRMQLEVYLNCEITPGPKVRLKLQQNTISSILSSCFSEDGRYEVSAVLGKQVGPVPCYVQHVNSSVGLEEICLLQAGTRESQEGLDFAL